MSDVIEGIHAIEADASLEATALSCSRSLVIFTLRTRPLGLSLMCVEGLTSVL